MNTLVSVIIPTYGKPNRLMVAIDSVLAQNYPHIEIIIVDDNGKGTKYQFETQKIINHYLEKGEKLKYICHIKNKNGSAARNTGIKAAKGTYIALLDDDDIFLPNNILEQVQAINALNGDYRACYTSFSILFPDGRKKEVAAHSNSDISLGILIQELEIPSSSLIFTKAAWEKLGGFDESFLRHQDWEFITRLGRICDFTNVSNIGMIRFICRRNTPRNPEDAKRYREHYLINMQEIISKYPKKVQKRIYYLHRMDIAVEFLKRKKYFLGLTQLASSGNFFSGIIDISKRMHRYKNSLREVTNIDSND